MKLERTKSHVNIGTIGHVGHGKTTTTVTIIKVLTDKFLDLNEPFAYDAIDKAPEEKKCGITINASRVEYQTEKRHCAHVGVLGRTDYIENMIASTTQMGGAILVVAAIGGPVPQTCEYILLVRQVGVPHILVTLNRYDMVDNEEVIELIEMEARELLAEQGYDEEALIIHISALKVLEGEEKWVSSILELMEVCDENIPDSVRETDKPLLMPTEGIFIITGRGTVATDRVECGVLNVNDEVETLGIKEKSQKTTVTGIEMFRRLLDSVKTDDSCGLLPHGTKREDIECGRIAARPGAYTPYTEFEGSAYTPSKDEDGHHTLFFSSYRPQFYFRIIDVTGVVSLPEGVEMVMPGDNADMSVKLIQPVAMDEGLYFAIREGGHTVGVGHVTKVIK